MKRLAPILILLVGVVTLLPAQANTAKSLKDTVIYLHLDSVEAFSIQRSLDSLLPNTHYTTLPQLETDTAALNTYHFTPDIVPVYTAEEYQKRLTALNSPIPLDYNSYVQSYIDLYTIKRRGQVSRMLGLSHFYYPMFEQELDRQGMPLELRHLAVVESALNPHAVSRAGATGLWQFMFATGKMYGLKVTSYVDERRDPEKATAAAAQYFKRMYASYGDWLLVIAAYNCGPGNVNKAIARSGGKKTFWEIRKWLPRETRGYVPAFIAATYAMSYPAEHNIYPIAFDFSFMQDTIQIDETMDMQYLAKLTDTEFRILKDLNPELKSNKVPPGGYSLRVPFKCGEIWAAKKDSITEVIAQMNPNPPAPKIKGTSPITKSAYSSSSSADNAPSGTVLMYHTVRSGEVVGKIAERYHVSASSVSRWNGLRRYRIRVGQKLKIYAPARYASSAKKKSTKKTSAPVKLKPGQKYHTVQSGDTLWDIANMYEGLTLERLKELNSLSSNSLKVGQKLIIAAN